MLMFNTAAILVGGKSTRMGQDKKHLKLIDRWLLQNIVDQLGKIFGEVIIVGCTAEEIPFITGYHGVYPDTLPIKASLNGVYTALVNSPSHYVYTTACDMPHYDVAYINFMKEKIQSESADGCITRYMDWIEPFNAFYSRNLISSIKNFLKSGRKSIHHYLKGQNIIAIDEADARRFSPNWHIFNNLNTLEEYKKFIEGKNDNYP